MEVTHEKSLQSCFSCKHSRGRGTGGDSSEASPTLLNHQPETGGPLLPSDREVIVDIDPGISSPGVEDFEDPLSKPQEQKTPGQIDRDMDPDIELRNLDRNSPPLPGNTASILSCLKKKFSLIDPPVINKVSDPFLDKYLPDEYGRENFSAFTTFQWVSLVGMMVALICTLFISDFRKVNLWKIQLWKLELMILVLICGELISGWGFRLVVSFIGMSFFFRRWVLYFVHGIRKRVQIFLWLGLVVAVWLLLFDKGLEAETEGKALRYATKMPLCLFIGFLTWLTKTLMVNVSISFFHVINYFDRIKESLISMSVIETLSKPPGTEIQKNVEDEEKIVDEERQFQRAGETILVDLQNNAFSTLKGGRVINHLLKLTTKNVCAWNMKRMMNIFRHGNISLFDEPILGATSGYDAAQTRITEEGKAAARKIFSNVACYGFNYIRREDLMRFMGEDEADNPFDGDSDSNMISESSLENWVVNALREQRALTLTLNNIEEIVCKLRIAVNIFTIILLIFVCLHILELATTKFFLFVCTLVAFLVFITRNTCKTVFEGIFFLFVRHPFDVGDWCEIDGVQMKVEKMNILETIFLTYDHKQNTTPNSVLATKSIQNFNQSPDMIDSVEFCVPMFTPPRKNGAIRERILKYVNGMKEHWFPNPMIVCKGFEGLNMRFEVRLTPRMSHQDMDERMARRGSFVEEIVKILHDLDSQDSFFPSRHQRPSTTSSNQFRDSGHSDSHGFAGEESKNCL